MSNPDEQREPAPRHGEPEYGMRLPEGARIEDFIVPRTSRGARDLARDVPERPAGPPLQRTPGDRWGYAPRGPYGDSGSDGAFPPPSSDDGRPWGGPGQRQYRGGDEGQYRGRYPDQYRDQYPGPYPWAPQPPAWHPESPEEEARRLRRKRATLLTVLGALAMVLAPLGGILGGTVSALGGTMDAVVANVPVANGDSVELPADSPRAVAASGGGELTQCTITNPTGSTTTAEPVAGTVTREGTMALPGARFHTGAAGQYTISCADVAEGSQLLVGPPLIVRNAGTVSAWMTGGFLLGAVGLGVLVWGVITLRRTRAPR